MLGYLPGLRFSCGGICENSNHLRTTNNDYQKWSKNATCAQKPKLKVFWWGRPSLLPSVPSSLLSSLLRLPLVFHSSTSGAQGPRPPGFLARRSSSSAFCFQLWPTLLHFCCVSKYLLAFLFLTAPMLLSTARMCVCVCCFHGYTPWPLEPCVHARSPITF